MFVIISYVANKMKQIRNSLYVFEIIYFICAQYVQCIHRNEYIRSGVFVANCLYHFHRQSGLPTSVSVKR